MQSEKVNKRISKLVRQITGTFSLEITSTSYTSSFNVFDFEKEIWYKKKCFAMYGTGREVHGVVLGTKIKA